MDAIEKAARAIHPQCSYPLIPWDELGNAEQNRCRFAAKAAIITFLDSVQEPPHEVIEAALSCCYRYVGDRSQLASDLRDAWPKMLAELRKSVAVE